MSGRKRAGHGGNNSPRGTLQGHQVRQGSSFGTCPACGTAVHVALMSFHISSDCPVVGGDEVLPAKARTESKSSLGQEGTTERRVPCGTEQSPVGSSEFSLASAAMGKQGIRQKLAWEEEEEDVSPEEEKLQNRASFSSGAGARGEKVMGLAPETPIQEGRDKIAVDMAMSASPSASKGVKRSPGEARKRLFEDWGQRLDLEPEFVIQLSPDNAAAAAAAPSSPVNEPQAKKLRVIEPDVNDDSKLVVDLDSIDSGSEGDDIAHMGMRSSIRDSQQQLQKEEVAKKQGSHHTQKIPKKELEKKLESQQDMDQDNRSLEPEVEIQNGEELSAIVSEREEELESAIRELRDQCSRALLREIELQRALLVKNGECEKLRRLEQGSQEELLSERGRAFEMETTLQQLREECEKLRRREQGLKEELLSEKERAFEIATTSQGLREECEKLRRREQGLKEELLSEKERAFEIATTSQGLREECEKLRRREQGLQEELSSVRGRAFELETTLNEMREIVNKVEQKAQASHVNHVLDQSPPTQIYKEEESLATQLLTQTSNSLASCSGSPKAVKDEFGVTTVSSENILEMDNEVQATQLLSDGLAPQSSPCIPVIGKSFQASTDSRRVCGAGTTNLPNGTDEEFSLSPKTKLNSVDKCPVRRLFDDDDGTELTKANSNENSGSPLQSSMTTAASALSPQTLGKALTPAADEHDKAEGFDGNGNANLHTVGNQQTGGMLGGPKTPQIFAGMPGFQEKGLISEMLDSFPPAQGTETHYGVDPFDDHFLETLNKTVSNVTSISKGRTEQPLQGVRTFVSVSGADQKFSHDNKTSAMLQPTEDSQAETLAEMGSKKKRRKNPAVLIDSDSDVDIGNEGIVQDVRRSTSSIEEDSRKVTQDRTLSGTKIGKFDSHMGEQTSHPTAGSSRGAAMEASNRDRSFDERRPSSPAIDVLFGFRVEEQHPSNRTINVSLGMKGEEEAEKKNATGIQGGGSRERSCSVDRPDPIIEALKRDRNQYSKAFSPRSVNVILSSSDEEDYIWDGSQGSGGKKGKRSIDEEDSCTEGSRGSGGRKGKRRRLVKVQESPLGGADGLQPDPILEGTKGTGTKEVRRSERLRNAYAKQTTVLSHEKEESDSIEDMQCKDLGSNRDGSSSKPLILDDDDNDEEEDRIELDSNSSDSSPIEARPKHRNDKATQPSKTSAARRALFGINRNGDVDTEDDIDTDDSFINDDPELEDVDVYTLSSVDEISDSGEDSENDGSSDSRSPSDKRTKYNWELEGDMLAALGKDTDLCMRGLCALYRRQELDEKIWSNSTHKNRIGLSAFHAARASNYASFLMDGVMAGPVVKTAEELESEFDESAVTYCSDICNHYSKQLFDIYRTHEDPYFPEPYTDPLP